ncbi:hypothetical protein HDU91_001328, partial [Kappamyces sp. JEL0680]
FGYQFFWFIITIVTLPSQIEAIMGNETKGSGMAVISIFSGLLFLFFSPVAGALNDGNKVALPSGLAGWGKRRPWILVGCLGMCLSLFFLTPTDSLADYTIAYLFLNFSSVVCSIPFNGLVADVTPLEQNGHVSSIMGALNLLGYLVGALVGIGAADIPLYTLYFLMSSVFIICTLVTCVYVEEAPSSHDATPIQWRDLAWDILRPLWTHKSFMLVFVSRFLFQLGIATIQSFLQYWISDCVATSMEATTAVSVAMIPNLVLAPLCALLVPKTNRKRTVYVSAVLMTVACVMMMVCTEFEYALLVSSFFGMGYGPFMTCEFAMLMDVLPKQQDAARDMSLWHTALILPQIVSTPLAGWLLDYFQGVGASAHVHCLGYKVPLAV